MELNELKRILSNEEDFRLIKEWNFKKIKHGTVSRHKYIVSRKNKNYFVKEVKENEKLILLELIKVKSNLIPEIFYPNLLNKNILVQQYISGGHLKSKKAISPQLIREFAIFQNIFNKTAIRNKINKFSGCKSNLNDEGDFFRNGFKSNFDYDKDLLNLKIYKLPIVNRFIIILNHIRKDKEKIIDEFCKMPFARQHHDFKEDNIIGKTQKLVDWGSSYGHGPFLFDLAPFLINNKKAISEFKRYSDICKKYSEKQIERWLYVALVANFASLLRYRLNIWGYFKNKAQCKNFLEYEYQTYKFLLK